MKKFYVSLLAAIASLLAVQLSAQQLPNPGFENWETIKYWGATISGEQQPTGWHGSHVSKEAAGIVVQKSVTYKAAGRTGGNSVLVKNVEVGAAGIYETTPGYFALGTPWQNLNGLDVNNATGGTSGGLNFAYRPDSMEVWIKRAGDNISNENYNVLFYSWKGTSRAEQYQGKSGSCSDVSNSDYNTNEESDIRQALDANKCGTKTLATQIAEGWIYGREIYEDWVKLVIPIYYMNDDVPEKCNVIFASSGYPNFRVSTGIYEGNGLYVDDVRLIYSSKIDHIFIGDKEWKGFNPDVVSPQVQVYSLGNATAIPSVYGKRGVGKLTNLRGATANFTGRKLTSNEFTILKPGTIDGDPMEIQVKAEDGSSTTTYKIQFVSKQSNNNRLAAITVNGEALKGFNPYVTSYNVELPYGTTAAPKVEFEKAEDAQTVSITQPTSTTGTATIKVTAQDGSQNTYTIKFSVAQLSDNTLADILLDGESLPGFSSTKRNYTVELPLGTTAAPKITYKSNYPNGAQTVSITNDLKAGAQISVTTPGNQKANVYKITYVITASTYSYLKDLTLDGVTITDFQPSRTDYYVGLPMGTTALPKIGYTAGDKYQSEPKIEYGGLDGVTKITVTAAAGNQTVYRLTFSVEKSTNVKLADIMLDGKSLEDFDPDTYEYVVSLGTGATTAPKVTAKAGDSYQTIDIREGGLTGTTRIIVTAGDGKTTKAYNITFTQTMSTVNTLGMIYIGGTQLTGFNKNTFEYTYQLPQGTTSLPEVTYQKGDNAQTVTVRTFSGLSGDYKIIVKPQSGSTNTYVIHFSVQTSSNVNLRMIYYGGQQVPGFAAGTNSYTVTLPMGTTTLPALTWDVADNSQRVIYSAGVLNGAASTLLVRAEDGSTNTYSVAFVVPVAGVSTLLDIQLDGKSIEGFSPDITSYTINLPQGTTKLPVITYTANDEYQTIRKTEGGLTADTRIVVRAQNGSTTTYVLHFVVATSSNANLAGIRIGNEALADFSPTVYEYSITLPASVSRVPTVTFTKAEQTQTVTVQNGSFSQPTTIRVVAEDGITENTYTIRFTQQHSENALLKMIYLDGEQLKGFSPEQLEYSHNLPLDATACPVITVDKEDGQRVSITMPVLVGTASIVVEPETGEQNIYTIRFTQAASTNSQLAAILIDGVLLADFEPAVTTYNVTLAAGATTVPRVSYETADEYQTVYMTSGGLTDKTYLKVVAADETYTIYTLSFAMSQAEVSSSTDLAQIMLDGQPIAQFDPEQQSYTYRLTGNVAPKLTAQRGEETQTIVISQPEGEGTATIEVTAADGSQQVYTVEFEATLSHNTSLAGITVDGTAIAAFDAAEHHYQVELPIGTATAPTVSATKAEDKQAIEVKSGLHSAYIYVTAEDGSRATYSIDFVIEKSSDSQLAGLMIGGQPLADFSAERTNYEVELPRGTAQLPPIAVEKAYEAQRVVVNAPLREGAATITVYAEDYTADNQHKTTYTINVTAKMSDNAKLEALRVNGVNILTAGKFDYTIDVPAFSTPLVDYTAGDEMQTIGFVDNGLQGTQIEVASEDGTQHHTYTVTYNEIPNSDATLKDLLVFNGTEFVSIFDINETSYSYPLAWRTRQVPAVWAVGNAKRQTIEVKYGAVNETTIITVTAQDGIAQRVYKIDFPVDKSANVKLDEVTCEVADVMFDPDQLTYTIDLQYGTTEAPMLYYKKQEPEQQVIYTYAPLGEKSMIEVVAENGTKQTYEFSFNVLKSENENILPLVNLNLGEKVIPVNLGDVENVTVDLPYGTKNFVVEVPTKNFDEQTVHIINGGAYNNTTITVYPNRGSEKPKVYTIVPNTDVAYPTSADGITIDGAPLAGFERDKYAYVLSVSDQPMEVIATAHNASMLVDNEAIAATNHRQITIEDPDGIYATTTYDLFFYYPGDFSFDTTFDNFDNISNTLKGAGLMDMTNEVREKAGILPCAELVIGDFKDDTHNGVTPHNWNSPITANTAGLKNKDDMGYFNSGWKEIFTGKCWILPAANINISSIIGSVITDYAPESMSAQVSDPKTQGSSAARISTEYVVTSAESLPGVYSLSEQYVNIGMWMLDGTLDGLKSIADMLAAASSPTTLTFGEPITFRNTPDKFSVQVKPESHQLVQNWGVTYYVNGGLVIDEVGDYSSSEWKTIEKDLAYIDGPATLDIRINSCGTEIPHDMYVKNSGSDEEKRYKSTLYVDNMLFTYRSDLTGLKVNGQDATLAGSDFTITLDADDYYGKPELTFLRGVEDQQQTVTWNADYTQAQIESMAEDCETKTNYTLNITRNPSTNSALQKLYVGGTELASFVPNTTQYTINYDGEIPDLQAVAASNFATVTLEQTEGETKIHVQPESGVETVYVITWKKNEIPTSAVATFTAAKIDGVNAETETFFTITKSYDGQTVVFDETSGTVVCTASDATTTETINDLVAAGLRDAAVAATTYGVLTTISNSDMLLRDYDGENVFSYDGEQNMRFAFERKDAQDIVIETITDTKTTFVVKGTDDEKTYIISTPEEVSSNAALLDLLVNGQPLEGFYGDEDGNYTIYDLAAKIQPVIVDGQTVTISYTPAEIEPKTSPRLRMAPKFKGDSKGEYTIHVVASDGIAEHTIKLVLGVKKSDKTELASLMVGTEVLDVTADPAQYTVTLTVPQPKTEQTTMPSIVAVAGAEGQTIELEDNGVNATSYIIVTAENGTDQKQYDIEVLAAKSAYSKLDMLEVNGVAVALTDGVTDYDVTLNKLGVPEVEAKSDDMFAVVSKTVGATDATIEVEAEDGSKTTYHLNFSLDPSLSDAHLATILLDGKTLDEWQPYVAFNPDTYDYDIVLQCGTKALPVINAVRRYATQTVSVIAGNVNSETIIDVTSPDGIEYIQYRLHFSVALSANCDLAGLSIDYQPLAGFTAGNLTYDNVEILNESFVVQPVRGDAGQTIDIDNSTEGVIRVSVTSEDLSCTQVYTINYEVKKCKISTLSNLLVGGNPLPDFQPDVLAYTYVLPLGEKTVPGITAVAGCDGQIITTDIREAGETSYIKVRSEDLSSETEYRIFFELTLSDNCDLDMITENGDMLPGFQTDILNYEFEQPVGTRTFPTLGYLTSDANATVDQKEVFYTDYRRETRFYVTAENGKAKKTYSVVYETLKSDVDVLSMIYLDDVPLDGFVGVNNNYNVELEIGTATLPLVTADKGDEYQQEPKIIQLSNTGDAATYNIIATSESGLQRVYTLELTIKKSTNLNLRQITIDGFPIELSGTGYTASSAFDPAQTEYLISWAVGTPAGTAPVIGYQADDEYQVITMSAPLTSTKGVVTINVQNQLGQVRTYTVRSEQLHSDNDMLAMITLDGSDIADFEGQKNSYSVLLPVGQTDYPVIGYDLSEPWQTVDEPQVVSANSSSVTYQIRVTAEAGNQRVYSVTLTLQLSNVDYLNQIYLGTQPLDDFDKYQNSYTVVLPHGTEAVPDIDYDLGDPYQDVVVTKGELYAESYILVMAQNGQVRTYSIYFDVAKSSESELEMIYADGKSLDNFQGDRTDYTVILPYGESKLPQVTFDKKEPAQTVVVTKTANSITLSVTAEDGVTTTTYVISFENAKSTNATLLSIELDGNLIDGFDKEKFDYQIELPYGTHTLPDITWTVADEQQTVNLEQTDESYTLIVRAGDGITTNEYVIDFTVALSPEARLAQLSLDGTLIEGWNPDTTHYHLVFPTGTDSTELYTTANVTYITIDPDATAVVTQQSETTITVIVTAPNGNIMVYVIEQSIKLSDNALLADLTLDSVTIAGFDPYVFTYEYDLYEGQTIPEVLAVAQDTLAEVSVTVGAIGELTNIYCTAQDGTEKVYTILFRYSEIDVNATPNEGSCYWEYVPGTMQYKAVTICNNVQCAVFDFEGHLLMMQDVVKANPNSVDIGLNRYGQQVIYQVSADAEGTLFTMPFANQTYFYVFFQNGQKILSGKFLLAQ